MRTSRASDAMIAALPLAAGFTIHLVRVLPIQFRYQENSLGIVSLATLQRYPLQKEMFWLVFSALTLALLAWAFSRAFGRVRVAPRTQASIEAFAVLGLVLALWLPGAAGALGCFTAALAALGLSRRADPLAPPAAAPTLPDRRGSIGRRLLLVATAALISTLLTTGIWPGVWNLVQSTPDVRLVANTFDFHAEVGQHLAWADAIRRGELHGRDFFCLYGPLYDMAVVGFWELTGRSIAAYRFYVSFGRILSFTLVILLCAALVRRKSLALALPLLLPFVDLRVGLALTGLLVLGFWLKSGRRSVSLAAGLVAGTSLLYSQEFGLALLISASAAFAVTREGRAAAAYAIGLSAVVVPMLGWYAAQGALGPMLDDLVQYPRYVAAGYGKRFFPSLVADLPLRVANLPYQESLILRLAYSVPFVCAATLLIAVPVAHLRLRHPLVWIREAAETLARDPLRLATVLLALFGALSFRSALGRTDLGHILMILAPSALLLVVGFDRLVSAWIADPVRRCIVATRAVALALLVLHSGLLEKANPTIWIGHSREFIAALARGEYKPRGDRHVQQVWRWVLANTEKGEPVLFLPDSGSYYYLTRRPSPIRFVLGHQLVTDDHRAEVLAALRERPPRYIVWDDGQLPVDGIRPRAFLGAPLFDWIERSYSEDRSIGKTRILRYIEPAAGLDP